MSEIDWSRPIEAVHEDGRVVAVTLSREETGTYAAYVTNECPDPREANSYWEKDGRNCCYKSPWRIRNVAQPTPERDPALWDRMEALVKEMALRDNGDGTVSLFKIREHVDTAMSIVAALPQPVDPDEETARAIREIAFQNDKGSIGSDWITTAIMEGIKHGRAAQDAARG